MTNDAPERVAQLVYERGMLYLRTELPAWTPGGNSLAQDEARAVARLILDHTQADKEAAVAAEREACAMVANAAKTRNTIYEKARRDAAEAIRARGDTDALAERDARVKAEALLLMLLTQDSGLFPEVRATLVDLVENAIDDVHDMDVTFKDYAESVVGALLKNVVPPAKHRPAPRKGVSDG